MLFKQLFSVASLMLSMSVSVYGKPMIVGYNPSWKAQYMAGFDYSPYTHVNMAFGIPTADGGITYDGESTLQADVDAIHSAGAQVLLSVGGWSGSSLFSTILKDDTARTAFLTNMVNLVKTYSLDGLDIDWEYPGRAGAACNVFDAANDTPNFLAFLQDLRKQLTSEFSSSDKLITMAVRVDTFEINGVPSDVSEFAKVVDYVHLMQYDINGAWMDTTGPNAPLNFETGKGYQVSFASAIDAWTSQGWPASQMTAGMPFYGRAVTATVDMTLDPTNQYQALSKVLPQGDSEDLVWADTCDNTNGYAGNWQWKYLRSEGILSDALTAASPWVRQWDDVSQTPWLFNPETKMFISYDDPKSLQAKVDYAASKGLAGTMVWSMNMEDSNNELLSVLQTFPSSGSSSSSSSSSSANNTPKDNEVDNNDPLEDDTSDDSTTEEDDTSSSSSSSSRSSSSSSSSLSSSSKSSSSSNVNKNVNLAVDPNDDQGASDGETCSTEGEYKCSDSDSPSYYFCVYGKWLELSCSTGTVCNMSSGAMVCDWPSSGQQTGDASDTIIEED